MKKRFWISAVLVALLLSVLTTPALADSGPKPSVVVDFKGLEEETYYVTLLSEKDSTGPWSKKEQHDGGEYRSHGDGFGEQKIWERFNDFQDTDGFFFLGYYEDCSESDSFRWSYYPPGTFKILIFFPEYDRLIVSADIFEKYAFDSYFTADATNLDILSASVAGAEMPVSRTYDFGWEIASLLCRMLATIAIELAIALLFSFRAKKQLMVIAVTNVATQGILNVLLNIVNYNRGAFAFVACYVLLELVVFVIEGIVFAKLLRRHAPDQMKKLRPWLYALAANIASLAIGMLVARWMPGIF